LSIGLVVSHRDSKADLKPAQRY